MAPRDAKERSDRISALGVIAPPPILIQTPAFDGSLAMLFACVRERRVDLLDVPLFPICEAYFAYLIANERQDLDEAAAALVALAYLLERKAWLLLPSSEPEPEADHPLELPEPTAHEYRLAVEALRVWQEERSHLFFRSAEAGPDVYELPYSLEDVKIADLAMAFERLLRKASPQAPDVGKPRRSLEEQMRVVLTTLGTDWRSLDAFIKPPFTRTDLVFWFLALLELMRIGQVQARLDTGDVEFRLQQPSLPLEAS